ncbi:MAG TPA: OmpA family protein [Candidatus Sulfotelmatobacter sp.]|nr:OmpA family protein [Candidatus Sulfotelmatobacter sp.]
MRTSILIALLFVLALGASAQNNGDSAPNSAAVSSGEREPLASPRPKDFWDGDDPNLVNLVTHPFANKKYVQRHVGPIHDRLNELEQITAENSGRIKDVDTRAQQGIQLASEKTTLADQHSGDATNKAQAAQTAANQASARVSTAEQKVANLDQYQGTAQTEIRFRPGQTVLTKSAKDALDDMTSPLRGQQGYIIEIRGFAPGQGQAAITSARRMADSVVRYLVLTHNIPVYRIYEMSMGNAQSSQGKHVSPARVEVSILKNDLATSPQR